MFLHVKVRFAITKTLLATEREQPKAAPTGQDTNSTKKQQFDRQIQAFAGYFQAFAGKVHPLQIPVFSPDFVLQTPDFILQTPDFRAHKKSANFFGGGFDRRCGEFGKIFWATRDQFLKL